MKVVTKMNLEEYKGVYVFAQQVDNEVCGIAYELLGKAKELAADLKEEVTAVLIGHNVKNLADKLAVEASQEYETKKEQKQETH